MSVLKWTLLLPVKLVAMLLAVLLAPLAAGISMFRADDGLRMKKVTLENPNVDIAVARQVTAEVLADIRTLGAQL